MKSETVRLHIAASLYDRCHCVVMSLCFASVFTGFTGCRSDIYRAGNLPQKYRISSIANRSKIDLSRLSSTGTSNRLIASGGFAGSDHC